MRQLAIQSYTRRGVDLVPSIRCTLSTGQSCFELATNCKQVACADTTGHPLGAAVGFSRLCLNRCRTAPNPPFPEHRHSPRRRPLWNASKLLPAACVPSRSPLTATPARLHAARADLGLVPTPLGIDCNPGRGGPRLPSARSSEAVVSGPAFATHVEPSPCHDLA